MFLDDEPLMKNLCRAPAAQSMHHAFIGGFARAHAECNGSGRRDCTTLSGAQSRPGHRGIFLHDIAKTWELSYDSASVITDGGQLVGHIVKSAM